MCITESLCCTAEIGATLYVNYTSVKKKNKNYRSDKQPGERYNH